MRRQADAARAEVARSRRQTWGPLAGLVGLLSGTDAEVARWEKGAAAEEQLASTLEKAARRHGFAALHDRAIPGRRENLDHLIVTAGGVWVVDSKAYSGRIRTGTHRLRIGSNSGDKLIAQAHRQAGFVTHALHQLGAADVPVFAALCFTGAEMGWLTDGSEVESVTICRPPTLVRALRSGGSYAVTPLAEALGRWFVPAT